MIASVVDILILASIILFILGFSGVLIRPIRRGLKAINEKFRLRHLFIGSLLCFSLGLAMGWEDAVKAFNEGVNEARNEVRHSENGEH